MIDSVLVRRLIQLALEEDLAFGDITSELSIDADQLGRAAIVAKEELVMCGGEIFRIIAEESHRYVTIDVDTIDGKRIKSGSVIARLQGNFVTLLALERTMLNFLQRMCGIATHTSALTSNCHPLVILDTRKTLPGWRLLDKYAVRIGGGVNHRMGLGDMILVKNNHIDAHPQGMRGVLTAIKKQKAPYVSWEVEVRNLEELKIALEFGPPIVMFDNFSNQQIVEGVTLVRATDPRPFIEVSGGITDDRLQELKTLGIDAASMGRITNSARSVDISMKIEVQKIEV